TTQFGGEQNGGTIFRMDASGAVTLLHSCNGGDGAYPAAAVYTNGDGKFYGTTEHGGFGPGTVFRLDLNLPPTVPLSGVASRKNHGTVGPFDSDLPLAGGGIECRSGGASGDYTLVFKFPNLVRSVASVAITEGAG